VACIQPFACLPNHVTGKGMIRELRRRYPEVTVAAIDYDPGASEVNQLNRLKLLLASARDSHSRRGSDSIPLLPPHESTCSAGPRSDARPPVPEEPLPAAASEPVGT
jgi:hypothetical protein